MTMTTPSPAGQRFTVTVEQTGASFPCKHNETALEALLRAGSKGISVGCRGGGCGVCKVAVLQGDYACKPMSRSHVTDEDERSRHVLACCIRPQSDLLLQVIGKLSKAVCRPTQLTENVPSVPPMPLTGT